jgi:hypothetical protein
MFAKSGERGAWQAGRRPNEIGAARPNSQPRFHGASMTFHVSKHATDRYLQRVEGCSFSERNFHVNRVRARTQIKDDLRGVRLDTHQEHRHIRLPNYIAVVRHRSVITILKPGMDSYLPTTVIEHTPAAADRCEAAHEATP